MRFLTLLDEEAATFCFQVFDDSPEKRKDLARTLHGELAELWPKLNVFNRAGAGIFVAINAVEPGKPRNAGHVKRVRAVFADFDPPKTSAHPARYPLPPVVEVETSPGKRHAYWTCDDLPQDEFTPVQRAIVAALGSDPAPVDLPRVMRLPGFYHRKDPNRPFLVRLVSLDERLPYSAKAIREAFPPLAHSPGPRVPDEAAGETVKRAQVGELRSALLFMRSDDRALWVRIGLALNGLGDLGRGL